jgi:hypothetical protein
MSLLSEFRDTGAILRYAFRTKGQQILAGSSIFRQMMSTGIKVTPTANNRLSLHEQHAQSSMILSAVDRLPDQLQAVIYGFYDGAHRDLAVHVLDKVIDTPKGTPQTIKTILIREWLERDNRKIGRHIMREQDHLIKTGEIDRALSRSSLHYARKIIFKQLDELDIRAHTTLETYWRYH